MNLVIYCCEAKIRKKLSETFGSCEIRAYYLLANSGLSSSQSGDQFHLLKIE